MSKECIRMCIACRKHCNKDELSRFVLINDNITLDRTGKYNARGFYLCRDEKCVNKLIHSKSVSRRINRRLTENEISIVISSLID